MHSSSMENMRRCIEWYWPKEKAVVADLGAADVNGSYRSLVPEDSAFTGFDLGPGPGVDIVLKDPYSLPLADGSVDVVMSGQMLEHCAHFWRVFTEIERVLAPGGVAFMIAPSTGKVHRYPVDCWRFYPDSYAALADWCNLRLVHAWTDERGPWKDITGVFQKGGSLEQRRTPKPLVGKLEKVGPHPDPKIEETKGERPYQEVLAELHALVAPDIYLEIGVRRGRSLRLSNARRTIAIDPFPEIDDGLAARVELHRSTSDDFFYFTPPESIGPVNMAFIDGLHTAEAVYRDFMNVERVMAPGGIIVLDDVLPNNSIQGTALRQSRAWAGDVWRFVEMLASMRPDLKLTWLDTAPTGLLVVANLDPKNELLWEHYNRQIGKLAAKIDRPTPAALIERTHAVSPTLENLKAAILGK